MSKLEQAEEAVKLAESEIAVKLAEGEITDQLWRHPKAAGPRRRHLRGPCPADDYASGAPSTLPAERARQGKHEGPSRRAGTENRHAGKES